MLMTQVTLLCRAACYSRVWASKLSTDQGDVHHPIGLPLFPYVFLTCQICSWSEDWLNATWSKNVIGHKMGLSRKVLHSYSFSRLQGITSMLTCSFQPQGVYLYCTWITEGSYLSCGHSSSSQLMAPFLFFYSANNGSFHGQFAS